MQQELYETPHHYGYMDSIEYTFQVGTDSETETQGG